MIINGTDITLRCSKCNTRLPIAETTGTDKKVDIFIDACVFCAMQKSKKENQNGKD